MKSDTNIVDFLCVFMAGIGSVTLAEYCNSSYSWQERLDVDEIVILMLIQ